MLLANQLLCATSSPVAGSARPRPGPRTGVASARTRSAHFALPLTFSQTHWGGYCQARRPGFEERRAGRWGWGWVTSLCTTAPCVAEPPLTPPLHLPLPLTICPICGDLLHPGIAFHYFTLRSQVPPTRRPSRATASFPTAQKAVRSGGMTASGSPPSTPPSHRGRRPPSPRTVRGILPLCERRRGA